MGAIQALLTGTANDMQQKRALDWIIVHACRTYDMSYRPERPYDTAFAEGMRFVGNQIIKLTKLPLSAIED